jgi:hypothetical protein
LCLKLLDNEINARTKMNRDSFSEPVDGFDALATERLSDAEPWYQRIGAMKVKLVLPEDFDAPLPDHIHDDFEGPHK